MWLKESDIRWLLRYVFINPDLKNVTKLVKGSLHNIGQDSFNKILSQQLTHDRSYISGDDRVLPSIPHQLDF